MHVIAKILLFFLLALTGIPVFAAYYCMGSNQIVNEGDNLTLRIYRRSPDRKSSRGSLNQGTLSGFRLR